MPTSPSNGKTHGFDLRKMLTTVAFRAGTICLTLLLLFQSWVLLRGSWEVPGALLSRLNQGLEAHGWRAEYERVEFRFPFSLAVTQPRLSRATMEEALIEAEYSRVDLSLLSLLRGKFEIGEAALYGASIFCPASLSPTGARERTFAQVYATVSQNGETWHIQHLNGRLHNLSFSGAGLIPPFPKRETEPLDWDSLFTAVLPRLLREGENFARARNPQVKFLIRPAEQTPGVTVEAEGWADFFTAPHQIEIERIRLGGSSTFDGTAWLGEEVSFDASSLSWNSQATARPVRGTLHWPKKAGPRSLLPSRAELAVAEIESRVESLSGLQATFTLGDERQVAIGFHLFFQDEPIEGSAFLDWEKGDGSVDLMARINPTDLLQHEIARELGLPYEIAFDTTLFGRGTAWLENWQFAKASARADAALSNIDGVLLDQASARVELWPDRFVVTEMVLARDDFEARGSYEVDFDSKAYRLFFKGTLQPLHISPWFRDWWSGFWAHFTFPKSMLAGDLVIDGVHGQSDKVKIFGSVRGEDFGLRGIPFASLSANLAVRDGYIELSRIDLQRAEGSADGWFRYHRHPDTGGFGHLEFESDSTLNPIEVAGIFGEAGQSVVSHFHFSEPPELYLTGTVHGGPEPAKDRVLLKGTTQAPLAYHGLHLDRLTLEALLEGSDWTFHHIDAGLAGGEVSGDAQKWREGEEERLRFSLITIGLDMTTTLKSVTAWRGRNQTEEEANPSSPAPKNIQGIFDMAIEAEGVFGDFQSFSGEGSVQVRDADLAQVHLLGILSRILNTTPLGFTSLQFTEAESRFFVDFTKIHFPDLYLKGPTAEIRAVGDYLIDQEELDFSVKVRLMRESRVPFLSLLLSPLLEPLSHVLEIRLTGPYADPQWRFLLGPRNILSGIGGENNEETGPRK